MTAKTSTIATLSRDLETLGLGPGDGVFVHASLGAMGHVADGAATVIQALFAAIGPTGLLAMPGFCDDACFPAHIDRSTLSDEEILKIEAAVRGFDPATSSTLAMGLIAETFRTWPGTCRSPHPTLSVCLNGPGAAGYCTSHPLAWSSGEDSPFGHFRFRPQMKILLIGVGWNRCTALHTAEYFADPRRIKTSRFKTVAQAPAWTQAPDVADDLNRLFPHVGQAFEEAGGVSIANVAAASCRLCNYRDLIDFASHWIGAANTRSGDVR